MNQVLKLTSTLAALALAACASAPKPVVVSSGALPEAGTYQIAEASSADELTGLVSARLEARGLRAAQEPRYLVQIGSFARPAAVGLFVPDANEKQWHRSPIGNRRGAVRGVIVSLTDKGSGREVYRVTAEEEGRERKAQAGFSRLVEAAFGSPSGKQARTKPH